MSAFFEPPPPPPERPHHRQPEWIGPPENVLPGAFPLSLLLARTDDAAVAVYGGLAYPNGFAFTLSIRVRDDVGGRGPIHHWHDTRQFDDDVLRFGIRFPDGSKATIFDAPRHVGREEQPTGPVLIPRGGGGGGRTWNNGFWVWPLPPPGRFAFVCEWPGRNVELTEVELDTTPIHHAAVRAETLWPDDDGPSGGSGWISTVARR